MKAHEIEGTFQLLEQEADFRKNAERAELMDHIEHLFHDEMSGSISYGVQYLDNALDHLGKIEDLLEDNKQLLGAAYEIIKQYTDAWRKQLETAICEPDEYPMVMASARKALSISEKEVDTAIGQVLVDHSIKSVDEAISMLRKFRDKLVAEDFANADDYR